MSTAACGAASSHSWPGQAALVRPLGQVMRMAGREAVMAAIAMGEI